MKWRTAVIGGVGATLLFTWLPAALAAPLQPEQQKSEFMLYLDPAASQEGNHEIISAMQEIADKHRITKIDLVESQEPLEEGQEGLERLRLETRDTTTYLEARFKPFEHDPRVSCHDCTDTVDLLLDLLGLTLFHPLHGLVPPLHIENCKFQTEYGQDIVEATLKVVDPSTVDRDLRFLVVEKTADGVFRTNRSRREPEFLESSNPNLEWQDLGGGLFDARFHPVSTSDVLYDHCTGYGADKDKDLYLVMWPNDPVSAIEFMHGAAHSLFSR
jgi:hypothetical protein